MSQGQDRAIPSLGLQLLRGNGNSPETFTALAEVKDISGPGLKLTTADSTHLMDTWKGIKPILLEGGQIKLTVNFLPNDPTHGGFAVGNSPAFVTSGILLDMELRTLRNWRIAFPDGNSGGGIATVWQFAAYVTGYAPKGSVTTIMSADMTLEIDGQPNFMDH